MMVTNKAQYVRDYERAATMVMVVFAICSAMFSGLVLMGFWIPEEYFSTWLMAVCGFGGLGLLVIVFWVTDNGADDARDWRFDGDEWIDEHGRNYGDRW